MCAKPILYDRLQQTVHMVNGCNTECIIKWALLLFGIWTVKLSIK